METGDIIWWKWNPPNEIIVNLVDYNFLFNKSLDINRCKKSGN